MKCNGTSSLSGKRCQRPTSQGSRYCWRHDPKNKAAVAKANRRTGKRKKQTFFRSEAEMLQEIAKDAPGKANGPIPEVQIATGLARLIKTLVREEVARIKVTVEP